MRMTMIRLMPIPLGCLHWACRERRGILSRGRLAKVHRALVRNIFSHVPSTKVWEIAAMLKAIHASEDLAAAREKANRVIEKLRGLRLSRAAELVETAVEETLTYYAFPEEHWRRIRTNNPLERILREIRRRTRVVGWFRDGQSALTSPPQGCATSP